MDDLGLQKTIAKIYDAAINYKIWPEVLNEIADILGFKNAALISINRALNYSEVISPRTDPTIVEAYSRHGWKKDPLIPFVNDAAVGEIKVLEQSEPQHVG